jgi:hypothetical protein
MRLEAGLDMGTLWFSGALFPRCIGADPGVELCFYYDLTMNQLWFNYDEIVEP